MLQDAVSSLQYQPTAKDDNLPAIAEVHITLYSAIAKNGEAADIRLLISPGTVLVATVFWS